MRNSWEPQITDSLQEHVFYFSFICVYQTSSLLLLSLRTCQNEFPSLISSNRPFLSGVPLLSAWTQRSRTDWRERQTMDRSVPAAADESEVPWRRSSSVDTPPARAQHCQGHPSSRAWANHQQAYKSTKTFPNLVHPYSDFLSSAVCCPSHLGSG